MLVLDTKNKDCLNAYYDLLEKNKDLKDRIKYFESPYFLNKYPRVYFIVLKGNKILAMAETGLDQYEKEPNILAMMFLSVDKDHQGKGLSSKILEEIFIYCKKNHLQLKMSSYTQEGFLKLRPKALAISKEKDIKLKETGLMGPPKTRAEEIFRNQIILREPSYSDSYSIYENGKSIEIIKNSKQYFDYLKK